MSTAPPRILCLCLGNICRSPTAEAVLRARAAALGLPLVVDSAGTGDWHAGEAPDRRAQVAARARGYDMSGLRARQIVAADFTRFDLILAMDAQNLADARALAPPGATARIARFLDAAGMPDAGTGGNVPDPWYTGGFDPVLTLIETAAGRLLQRLQAASAASPQAR